jgi:hypothetical protein
MCSLSYNDLAADFGQTVVVSVPHRTRGPQPFAVLRSFAGRRPDDINDNVGCMLGKLYSLSGLLTLKNLGLDEFPINTTHKVMKSEVQKAVLQYLFYPAYHIERRKQEQCSVLVSIFCGGSNPLVLSFLTGCDCPLRGSP